MDATSDSRLESHWGLPSGVWSLVLIDKTFPKHDLMACNTLFLPFILDLVGPLDTESRRPFLGLLTRP
jgi:hypothetical protein